jgi:hypothetical protein
MTAATSAARPPFHGQDPVTDDRDRGRGRLLQVHRHDLARRVDRDRGSSASSTRVLQRALLGATGSNAPPAAPPRCGKAASSNRFSQAKAALSAFAPAPSGRRSGTGTRAGSPAKAIRHAGPAPYHVGHARGALPSRHRERRAAHVAAPMRVLLTSDLHYKLRQYDWLLGAAPRFDVVVVAGDHVDAFSPVPGEVQIAALSASLKALAQRCRLLVCSGNHDLNARSADGEKIADWLAPVRDAGSGRGDNVAVDFCSRSACGTAPTRAVERMLGRGAERTGRWAGVPRAAGGRAELERQAPLGAGCRAIARYSPTAVFCGHIHKRHSNRAAVGRSSTTPGCSMRPPDRRRSGHDRDRFRPADGTLNRWPASRPRPSVVGRVEALGPNFAATGCVAIRFWHLVHQRWWVLLSAYCRLMSTR